jgi:hypothetical protein
MLAPVIVSFRGLSPSLGGVNFDNLKLLDGVVLNGRECVVVEESGRSESIATRVYFLDRVLNYCMIKMEVKIGDTVGNELNVDYAPHPICGFAPKSWRHIALHTATGETLRTETASVTQISINEATDDSAFELDFPAGTVVSDNNRGKQFIVRPDGSERDIVSDELRRGASYDDLLNTETGEAGRINQSSWSQTRLVFILITLAVCGALIVAMGVRAVRVRYSHRA